MGGLADTPSAAPREQGWRGGWKSAAAPHCSSSVGARKQSAPYQAKAAGEDRAAAAHRDPRRGKPGSGGPESRPPRPARVPGQRAPGGAAATSGAAEDASLPSAPLPEPGLALRSPNGRLARRSAAHLPDHRRRRRRRRHRSYHRISRDFAPPRAYPPPARTRRARSPSWKLQVAPCRHREVYTLLLFSHPASARAPDPEKSSLTRTPPRSHLAGSERMRTGLRSWEFLGCCTSSGCAQSDGQSAPATLASAQLMLPH
ncbi:serine/arginine repetitive matrix protein 1-like [Mastomys coucha]|uniref:serine/arginine repetitive matrix protein 1-like n=1 Tax=Mastomys coucha TaxID=35658 RepID=UPI0012620648|nr:serine/arginine repetitive matrix protein 1-like [Mastomys coucha]